MSVVVAVCYKSELGPQISFYEAKGEEEVGKYVTEVVERGDYIAHSFLPIND